MSKRSKRFAELVAEAKVTSLVEEMDLGGFLPTKLDNAIDQDWVHLLLTGATNAAEAVRYTSPEDEREQKRQLRKALALIVATAEEWEKRI
jgi:hypothetical protein